MSLIFQALFKKTILIISSLKWAFNFLLHQSFFGSSSYPLDVMLTNIVDTLTVRRIACIFDVCLTDSNDECAVCLCNIDEGDEIREVKHCRHIFHRVCLDRWIGYGHWTCPLCRDHLRLPRLDVDIHHEVLNFNFCDVRSSTDT
ncbi:hypothetical protein BUALT_Bualt17G0088800 [Buddleja alternifolia]|uniref:RING-type domain-containing protein n=1 Tax=Buddleja alternifolia TaxID=168488 RepID=A0AAV6W762_9LAMI|nr:hypothetical protein BUALT_Bualt17G0088800 [Buddleja alternifolia]